MNAHGTNNISSGINTSGINVTIGINVSGINTIGINTINSGITSITGTKSATEPQWSDSRTSIKDPDTSGLFSHKKEKEKPNHSVLSEKLSDYVWGNTAKRNTARARLSEK